MTKNLTKFQQLMEIAERILYDGDITDSKTFYKKLKITCAACGMEGTVSISWGNHVKNVREYYDKNNGIFKDDDSRRFATLQRKLDSNYCTSVSQQDITNKIQRKGNRKRSRTDIIPTVEPKRTKPTDILDDNERSVYVDESPVPASQSTKYSLKPFAAAFSRTGTAPKPRNVKDTVARTRTSTSTKLNVVKDTVAQCTAATKTNVTKDTFKQKRPEKLVENSRSRTTVPASNSKKGNAPNSRLIMPKNFFNFVQSSSAANQRRPDQFPQLTGLLASQPSNDIVGARETSRPQKIPAEKNGVQEKPTTAAVDTVEVSNEKQASDDTLQQKEVELTKDCGKDVLTVMVTSDDSSFVSESNEGSVKSSVSAGVVCVKEKDVIATEVVNSDVQSLEPVLEAPLFQSSDSTQSNLYTVAGQEETHNNENTVSAATEQQQQCQDDQKNNNMAQIVGNLNNISLAEDESDANATLNLFATLQRQASASSTKNGLRQLETLQEEAQQQLMDRYAAAIQQQPQNPSIPHLLELFRDQTATIQNLFVQQLQCLANRINMS